MKTYRIILIDDNGAMLSTQQHFSEAVLALGHPNILKETLKDGFNKILDELETTVPSEPITARELAAKELFGTYVRLRNKDTGEEVLVTKMHWWTLQDSDKPFIEFDGILPKAVHTNEASRSLYQSSVRRIIDLKDDRKWEEVK